jgi:hypothetical protein
MNTFKEGVRIRFKLSEVIAFVAVFVVSIRVYIFTNGQTESMILLLNHFNPIAFFYGLSVSKLEFLLPLIAAGYSAIMYRQGLNSKLAEVLYLTLTLLIWILAIGVTRVSSLPITILYFIAVLIYTNRSLKSLNRVRVFVQKRLKHEDVSTMVSVFILGVLVWNPQPWHPTAKVTYDKNITESMIILDSNQNELIGIELTTKLPILITRSSVNKIVYCEVKTKSRLLFQINETHKLAEC